MYSFDEFDEQTGSTVFKDPSFDGAVAGDLDKDGVPDVVILALDRVQAHSGKDGHRLWTWKPSGYVTAQINDPLLFSSPHSLPPRSYQRTGHTLHKLHLSLDGTEGRAYAIGVGASGEIMVTVLSLTKGTPTKTQTLNPPGNNKLSPKNDCITVQPSGQLVCVDASGQSLLLAELRVSAEFTKLDLKVFYLLLLLSLFPSLFSISPPRLFCASNLFSIYM